MMEIIANVIANTPEAIRELVKPDYLRADTASTLVIFYMLVPIIALVGLFLFLSWCVSERKSYSYRKLMTDMYVVGTVKKLAKEDGINLEDEFKEFKKWDKKQKNKDKDLDATIESSIQDRVTEKNEVAIAKLDEFKV